MAKVVGFKKRRPVSDLDEVQDDFPAPDDISDISEEKAEPEAPEDDTVAAAEDDTDLNDAPAETEVEEEISLEDAIANELNDELGDEGFVTPPPPKKEAIEAAESNDFLSAPAPTPSKAKEESPEEVLQRLEDELLDEEEQAIRDTAEELDINKYIETAEPVSALKLQREFESFRPSPPKKRSWISRVLRRDTSDEVKPPVVETEVAPERMATPAERSWKDVLDHQREQNRSWRKRAQQPEGREVLTDYTGQDKELGDGEIPAYLKHM